MKTNSYLSGIILLCVLLAASAAQAQDKVHLKEHHSFKDGRTIIYEGVTGEGFRLREVGKKRLKVELPDSTVVELERSAVSESQEALIAARNCHLSSSVYGASNPDTESGKENYIHDIKAGSILHVEHIGRYTFSVRSDRDSTGYVDEECLLPQMYNMVSSYRRKVFLDKNIKDVDNATHKRNTSGDDVLESASMVRPGGRMIPLEVSGEYMKLRDAAGNEGWTRSAEVMPEKFLPGGVYKMMWNLCNWSGRNLFTEILVILIYIAGLMLWVMVPAYAVYWLVVRIKFIPNWICKWLIVGVTLIYFLFGGIRMLSMPPMDHNTYWSVIVGFYILGLGITAWTIFCRKVTNERCPYWKCHAVGDYTVVDSKTSEYDEITTTTTTHSDGHKTKKQSTRRVSVTTYLKECNRCATTWTASE